jgi:Mrp family chromosome partitioning ATPase
MSRYFEVVSRADSTDTVRRKRPSEIEAGLAGVALTDLASAAPAELVRNVQYRLAHNSGVLRLTESFAPSATPENPIRLIVSGCRPGDGASSVVTGIAIDLSQRLGLRTLVVDAHLRHPTLRETLTRQGNARSQSWVVPGLWLHGTTWPRLQLASFGWPPDEEHSEELFESINGLLNEYPISVVDLGVLRLDASMLSLARPMDPIILVTRYGHTERADLASTIRALRTADRSLAGVILNAKADLIPGYLRTLLGFGG